MIQITHPDQDDSNPDLNLDPNDPDPTNPSIDPPDPNDPNSNPNPNDPSDSNSNPDPNPTIYQPVGCPWQPGSPGHISQLPQRDKSGNYPGALAIPGMSTWNIPGIPAQNAPAPAPPAPGIPEKRDGIQWKKQMGIPGNEERSRENGMGILGRMDGNSRERRDFISEKNRDGNSRENRDGNFWETA